MKHNPEIFKSHVLPIALLFLILTALFIPTILGASKTSPTGEATPTPKYQGYIPVVVKPGDSPTLTATPTSTATPTATLIPANLTIGRPKLISTPPIITYKPLEFEVVITNTGEVDIDYPFSVEISLEPTPSYRDVSRITFETIDSLAGQSSLNLHITSSIGYETAYGYDYPQTYFAIVDVADQILEPNEDNYSPSPRDSVSVTINPVPPSTPVGSEFNGYLRYDSSIYHGQGFVLVNLVDSNSNIVAQSISDGAANGRFNFMGLSSGDYTIVACFIQYGKSYFWEEQVTIPTGSTNIYRQSGPCPLTNN